MSTDAERARRYRRHKAGDHSLCVPSRCAAAETVRGTASPVTGSVTRPTGLDDSGQRLWAELTADGAPAPLTSVLLLQTCRIVDRLDRLDRQLRGEDWLRFYSRDDGGTEVTVYVDKVLAEEREQAVALKGLITELRQLMGKAKPQEQKGGGVLADLAARRAARSASTAG